MAEIQPVPAEALPFLGNEEALRALGLRFNPRWLKWFIDLIQDITTGGAVDHNTLGGLQGGTTNQFYHLTSAQAAIITGTQTANTVYSGPATGAVAVAAFRALVTADLANQLVTYAKIQNVTDARLLGRSSGSAGAPIEITVGTGLSLAAGALTSTITQYTNEDAQDAVGGILTDTSTIDFTYNDGANTITADVKSSFATAGVYTPTLFNTANLTASTAYAAQYFRVGNLVTISGKVSVDPTLAATATALGISIPIPSTFANDFECGGVAFASGIAAQGAAILADVANARVAMQWISADITNQPMFFTFTYQVI